MTLVVGVSPTGLAVAGDYAPIPPDSSAADQYAEGFPGAGGNIMVPDIVEGSSNPSGIPKSVAERLTEAGPDGMAVLSLVSATNPVADSFSVPDGLVDGSNKLDRPIDPNAVDGDGGPAAVAQQAFGGAGAGILMPTILLAVTFAGLAIALRRRA